MITMLLGGLWHGASFKFVMWGGLHGAALALHKYFTSLKIETKVLARKWTTHIYSLAGVVVTFHFVCFCWIFFRARNMETSGQMLTQIFRHFNGSVLPDLLSGYAPVFFLMLAGYILHFVPKRIESRAENWVIDLPLVGKSLVLLVTIVLVIQTKSAGIQPFIYFQF
jgi:D-alanyl-lipoteichoic acid acyltransferase DltB (MBOAT superfamily)